MKEKEFWALNWLRFGLALYLVLYHTMGGHYREIERTWIEASIGLGNMATTVFFVLSGFLLTHVYVVLKDGHAINQRSFFLARFSSLFPLHIIGFLLALLAAFLTSYSRGGIAVLTDPLDTATRMLGKDELYLAAFMNLALLNAWNPYYLIFNGPSWSLSALVCYYLLFPYAASKFYRMKSPGLALVILGVLFALPGIGADIFHRNDMFTEGLLHRNPLFRLPLFLSGIALCVLFSRNRNTAPDRRELLALGAIVAATFLGAAYLRFHGLHYLHFIRNGLYFPAALALVWISVHAPETVSAKVRYWGARLGGASLPMFLLHNPAYQLFTKAEKVITGIIMHVGPDLPLSSVIWLSYRIDQSLIVYPLFLIPLIIVCIHVQERFVVPTAARIKHRFSAMTNRGAAGKGALAFMAEHELKERVE